MTVPAAESTTVTSLHTAIGGCISMTVTLNWQLVLFPEASVATYVCVVVPIGKNAPVARPAVRITTGDEQLSVATGFRKDTFAPHLLTSFPTEKLAGQLENTGLPASSITMANVSVSVQFSSEAVTVTVHVPSEEPAVKDGIAGLRPVTGPPLARPAPAPPLHE